MKKQVLEALRNSIADQRGRWVLGPHPEASSEYRIRTRERSYVIDRLIRDANGIRWVVDYKTSRHEGADIEGFLDREQKRYAAQLDAVERPARRKLLYLHRAQTLRDLMAPPGNRLEALKGDRKGQHSIRVNDQWRICFRWSDGHAYDVEIVDYHS